VKKTKDGHIHLSVHVAPEVARAAKIQSIKEEMSMQEWITKAIMRQLAESGAARQPQGAA
jgi:predicted HicB family RNase H-like nuclease